METISYTTIDKSSWPDGPWQSEPDKIQFPDPASGMPCLIVRNRLGGWCGYVGVPETHPWHGKSYNDRLVDECPHDVEYCWECQRVEGVIEVHGGLTFANGCRPDADEATDICHVAAPGEADHIWWFGFDCVHSQDVWPGASYGHFNSDATYKDVAYVRSEVARLAAQLSAVH